MAEYIDREAVYTDACQGCTRHGEELGSCYEEEPCYKLICVFANAPAANVAPVVRGRWENYPSDAYRRCTACKTEFEKARFSIRANFCPNCGARMEG